MPQSVANFLGGATSGCISTLILQPLDVVKTRLQVSPRDFALHTTPHGNNAAVSIVQQSIGASTGRGARTGLTARARRYPGIISTMRTIIHHDSVFGLWRGVTPTVIRNTLGVGAYFVTLNNLSALLAKPDGTLSDRSTLFVGAAARSLSVTVLCPLSVIKTRLELAEYSSVYNGVGDALRKIARTEGVRGLFSGLTPAIVRDAPYSALYLLIFLKTKETMNATLGLTSNASRILKTSAAARQADGSSRTEQSLAQAASRGSTGASAAPYNSTGGSASSGGTAQGGITTGASVAAQAALAVSNPSVPAPERKYAKQLGMAVNFGAGAFGGGLATFLTQPQDVVKTRMQAYSRASKPVIGQAEAAQYRTVAQTVRTVMLEEGAAGFFRGAYPRFLKRVFGSAVTWMIYEEVVRIYDIMLNDKALLDSDDERIPGSRPS